MFSPFRAFRPHGGRRVAKTALSMALLTAMASASLIVSGPVSAGAQVVELGRLTINKVQVGGPAQTEFFIDIDCPDDAFDATNFSLIAGIQDVHDIPVGMTCTVTEQPAANFVPTPNPAVIEVTMDADGVEITFTNTFVPPPDLGDGDYDQYPGDDDFDFDTPFDDADDDPAPAEIAASNDNDQSSGGQTTADLGVQASGGAAPAPASDVAPQAMNELPRTGTALAQLGLMAGLLMIMFGLSALYGARRRQAPQP